MKYDKIDFYKLRVYGDTFECVTKLTGQDKLTIRGAFITKDRGEDLRVFIDNVEIDLLDNNHSWVSLFDNAIDYTELSDKILIELDKQEGDW